LATADPPNKSFPTSCSVNLISLLPLPVLFVHVSVLGAVDATLPTQPADNAQTGLVQIVQPSERAIFQRDNRNQAQVPVVCATDPAVTRVEARWVDRSPGEPSAGAEWHSLEQSAHKNQWTATFPIPAGWWRMEVRAKKMDQQETVVIERFGVGEVFVTCGQSNSANFGSPCQTAEDDRVSACSWMTGQWQHAQDPEPGAGGKGGSPWALLGDLLVKRYQVPVGFFCTGIGSTHVGDWAPAGKLYPHLKAALKLAEANGIRAVLWHQGESDSIVGTPTNLYAERLSSIIQQSRIDLGSSVPWGIAHASFHPSPKATQENQAAVRAGQDKVINEALMVFAGPDTDSLPVSDRATTDHVHLNATGLQAHAEGWAKALETIIPVSQTQ
jgi:hypothetical protein